MSDRPVALRSVNHLALVCKDMARTVAFYEGILGLKLVKTIELPMGGGQHFFFELGDGSCIAFFWFPDAPPAAPGIAAPRGLPTDLDLLSAHGSMNHLAFDVAADEFDAERERLIAAGVACSDVLNHDDSEWGVTKEQYEGTFLRSTYFFDPDGILLELACWTAAFGPDAVRHVPARAVDAATATASATPATATATSTSTVTAPAPAPVTAPVTTRVTAPVTAPVTVDD